MDNLAWKTETRKVADLTPAGYNPRKLTDEQRADLEGSIKEFGEVEPVVVNTDGTIIGGHQRVSIYADLGHAEIVVRVPTRKLTDEEERRLNLRLNKNTGEWDWAKLKDFDRALLETVGFGDEELRIGLGLGRAGDVDMDEERMQILQVYPPEAPRLKERAQIHFESIEEYERVKEAIASGKIRAADILRLV